MCCVILYTAHFFILHSGPGQPMLDVSMDDVEYLRGVGFTWTRIPEILNISRSTLYRHLDQEGIVCVFGDLRQ